ncbi:MAG TPA: isoprenylcysteine carboxylmethyltransferase family protein [Terriglobales bacterium]|nr:isoprenylcysteine carboxylmethyltransferase family protein [Terriglobales bacterium]
MIAQNILLTVIAGAAAAYAGWEFSPSTWTASRVLGLCLATVSFVLWTVARFQLGKSLTVTAQAKQLVTHGIYSRIRNPIYLFGSGFLIGYILLLARPLWLLIFAAVIPLQIWRIRAESRVLEAKFGEDYRAYRSRTWF